MVVKRVRKTANKRNRIRRIANAQVRTAVMNFQNAYKKRSLRRTVAKGKRRIIPIKLLNSMQAEEAFYVLDFMKDDVHTTFAKAMRTPPITLLSPYNKKLTILRAKARQARLNVNDEYYSNLAESGGDSGEGDAARRFVYARLREQGYIIPKH